MALCQKKTEKLWVWKAIDTDGDKLLDWECGDRSSATVKKMADRLEENHDVAYYCGDKYKGYISVFPEEKLVMSKKVTVAIERLNTRNRHWFGRFKRKSIVVSKTKRMVEATMALFARFRVNGDPMEIFEVTYN